MGNLCQASTVDKTSEMEQKQKVLEVQSSTQEELIAKSKRVDDAKFKFRSVSQRVFEESDKDKSGFIDEVEFYQMIKDLGNNGIRIPLFFNKVPNQQESTKLLQKVDQNKDGKLSFEEFEKVFNAIYQQFINAAIEDTLAKIKFQQIGYINSLELKEFMEVASIELGSQPPTPEDCRRMYKALDCNNDGRIDIAEFKVYMKAIISNQIFVDAVEGCGVFNTGSDENFDLGIQKYQQQHKMK